MQASLVCCWVVEANLLLERYDEALQVLDTAVKQHPRFPDLHHLQATISAMRWYESVMDRDAGYVGVPSTTMRFASSFPQAAKLMGFPVEF